jgi:trans-aconitate methyltransferase
VFTQLLANIREMNTITTKWKPELYNNKHSFVYNYGQDLIKLLEPKASERILDLGCGSGQLTFKINELSKETIGIDKSKEMIEDAKSKFKNIEFQVGDAGNFEFNEKFDSIFSNATLHWVKDYKNAIKCMYENLKSNGKIVLEFGGKGNVQIIVDQLRDSLRTRNYLKQSDLDLWYFPSIGEYSTELESVGFRVLLAEHYDRPTELADEKSGIKDWISMFAESFFKDVSYNHIEEIKNEVQKKVKEKCLKNGKWFADYKRIRIVAIKE